VTLTRRELVKLIGGAVVAFKVGCKSSPPDGDGVFADDELRLLRGFADVIIPPDDKPGGADLGAVPYIETLALAFDNASPPIFAGGPFSDRNPFPDSNGRASGNFPDNEFASFIELDRVAAAAWQLKVLGSDRVAVTPNEDLYGAVDSLEGQLKSGLRAAIDASTLPIDQLDGDQIQTLFDGQPAAFKSLLIQLVQEAAFSAPEYGGNIDRAGWEMCHFEGDSQPLGYSQLVGNTYLERPEAPLTVANPGADPEPITDDVRQLLETVIAVLGGRIAS
jgi:hypothetical protein